MTAVAPGRLREDFGTLPPGDIRNTLVALADTEPLMEALFQYRFSAGLTVWEGHSFGLTCSLLPCIRSPVRLRARSAASRQKSWRFAEEYYLVRLQSVILRAVYQDGTEARG